MSMPPRFGWPAAAAGWVVGADAAPWLAGAPAAAGLAASAGFAASAGLLAGAWVAAGAACCPPAVVPYDGGAPALPQACASITATEAPPTPHTLIRKFRRVRCARRCAGMSPP